MGKAAQAQASRDRARDARLKAARERRLKMDPDQLGTDDDEANDASGGVGNTAEGADAEVA